MLHGTDGENSTAKLVWQKSRAYRISSILAITSLFVLMVPGLAPMTHTAKIIELICIILLTILSLTIYNSVRGTLSFAEKTVAYNEWIDNHALVEKVYTDSRPAYKYIAIGFVIFFVVAAVLAILLN